MPISLVSRISGQHSWGQGLENPSPSRSVGKGEVTGYCNRCHTRLEKGFTGLICRSCHSVIKIYICEQGVKGLAAKFPLLFSDSVTCLCCCLRVGSGRLMGARDGEELTPGESESSSLSAWLTAWQISKSTVPTAIPALPLLLYHSSKALFFLLTFLLVCQAPSSINCIHTHTLS